MPGFPTRGEDGTQRKVVRYITSGEYSLIAYITTREGFPGSRFLIVRARPNMDPQSVETSDVTIANAKWQEWYLEWKKRGFGGSSGTGLDGAPPFEN